MNFVKVLCVVTVMVNSLNGCIGKNLKKSGDISSAQNNTSLHLFAHANPFFSLGDPTAFPMLTHHIPVEKHAHRVRVKISPHTAVCSLMHPLKNDELGTVIKYTAIANNLMLNQNQKNEKRLLYKRNLKKVNRQKKK